MFKTCLKNGVPPPEVCEVSELQKVIYRGLVLGETVCVNINFVYVLTFIYTDFSISNAGFKWQVLTKHIL